MDQTQKAARVQDLRTRAAAPFILVTEIRGTKSGELNTLRRSLEKSGMSFKVIKNTLAKRALAEVGVTGLDPKLKGMTGFVFSSADGIASARAMKDILKPFPTVVVRAGYFDGAVLNTDAVKIVAEMPGPEQILNVLLAPGRALMQVLHNHELKLAESESTAA